MAVRAFGCRIILFHYVESGQVPDLPCGLVAARTLRRRVIGKTGIRRKALQPNEMPLFSKGPTARLTRLLRKLEKTLYQFVLSFSIRCAMEP
jgi:hypothetical protein